MGTFQQEPYQNSSGPMLAALRPNCRYSFVLVLFVVPVATTGPASASAMPERLRGLSMIDSYRHVLCVANSAGKEVLAGYMAASDHCQLLQQSR